MTTPLPPLDLEKGPLPWQMRLRIWRDLIQQAGYGSDLHVYLEDVLDDDEYWAFVNDCHAYNDFTFDDVEQYLTRCGYILLEERDGAYYCSFHESVSEALAYAANPERLWNPEGIFDLDAQRVLPVGLRAVLL